MQRFLITKLVLNKYKQKSLLVLLHIAIISLVINNIVQFIKSFKIFKQHES